MGRKFVDLPGAKMGIAAPHLTAQDLIGGSDDGCFEVAVEDLRSLDLEVVNQELEHSLVAEKTLVWKECHQCNTSDSRVWSGDQNTEQLAEPEFHNNLKCHNI